MQKIWFKLDDHKVSQVDEQEVFDEAFGNKNTYKSACNLFYISKHIVEKFKEINISVFKPEFAQKFKTNQEIIDKIKVNNYSFELEQQNYYFT